MAQANKDQVKAAQEQIIAGSEQLKASAREQLEYGSQLLDKVFEANEKALNGAFTLAEINTDMLKKFSRKQAKFISGLVDLGRRQYDLASASKDPAALMGLQAQLGEATLEQWTAYANELPEIGVEAGKRYAEVANKMFDFGKIA